ncbi:MAG TPA: cytochrome c biogenesis protein CcdA [Symbiobacteriaceae bacterium]|nr:cytochrome c biogenesis protein CcdA [Symbiobacteriaceae bacterium]
MEKGIQSDTPLRQSKSLVRLLLIALIASGLAMAWLVVASLVGKEGVGLTLSGSASRQAVATEMATRRVMNDVGTTFQVTLVTPESLKAQGQDPAPAADGTFFLFYEENHYTDLPNTSKAMAPVLRVDGQEVKASGYTLVTDSGHHRTFTIKYPTTGPGSIELVRPDIPAGSLAWKLPLTVSLLPGSVSIGTFLTLSAGLLAALSPCLLQLTLYYLSSLAGVSLTRPTTRQVMTTALWFVTGMTVAYSAGGYLAGYAGQRLSDMGALGTWSRPISIIAGLLVLVMGLWTGAQGGAPMLCKLPVPKLAKMSKRAGAFGAMAMGFVFSLGCLQCFGGALFASLVLYAGSLGSPLLGALLLALFSIGISLPFLAAAAAWSRVGPLLDKVQRYQGLIASVSAVMMVTFGLLMVADRFHWMSSLLVRWFPFLAI